MRILQINKYLKYKGGSETYMFELSKELEKRGHEVKFWGMYDKDNVKNDFPEWEADEVNFKTLKGIRAKIVTTTKIIYSTTNRKKVGQVLDAFKPDIVHLHNYNHELTPSILPEIKKRNIKIVQTVHDGKMVCPYHRLFNFETNNTCTKCVTGSNFNCVKDKCFDNSLVKSAIGAFEQTLYDWLNFYNKYIDKFIIPSQFLANLIENKIDKKKIRVLHNFTSLEFRQRLDNIQYDFIFFGRISEEKGIFELLDIIKDLPVSLLIIGDGPVTQEVKSKIADIPNITFVGPKYNKELFDLLQKGKYVIQPSKWFENCPMTIIESYALQIPVVGSNHSGIKELIEDGKTGYLIDFNDQDKARKKLLEISKQSTTLLENTIKQVFLQKYHKDYHVSEILKIYDEVLNNSVKK
jgi:glycosyltransferase involved in cell wall biosynthesis